MPDHKKNIFYVTNIFDLLKIKSHRLNALPNVLVPDFSHLFAVLFLYFSYLSLIISGDLLNDVGFSSVRMTFD